MRQSSAALVHSSVLYSTAFLLVLPIFTHSLIFFVQHTRKPVISHLILTSHTMTDDKPVTNEHTETSEAAVSATRSAASDR